MSIWLIVSVAILIAAAVTDDGDDGQRFRADHAWLSAAIVTAAYIVSRGLAKAGVHRDDRQDNDQSETTPSRRLRQQRSCTRLL